MKVLILGGTGAMGIHLIELLVKQGDQVYVTTRSKRISSENLHYIVGNAQDFEFLQDLLSEEWEAIVDFMIYTTEAFKTRVKVLLKATKQYIFLSSARVYAESHTPIKEVSPRLLDVCEDIDYLKTEEYALTKARQEDVLQNSGYNNWTIIRPYITYSENRLQLGVLEKEEWLYRALKGRTIVFSAEISKKLTTLTYGFNVSSGIQAIIGKAEAHSQSFNIVTEHSFKWEHVLNIYLYHLESYLGYKPKVVLQDTERFLMWKHSKYQVRYDRLFNRTFNNEKISKYINTSNFISIEAGLNKTLNHFINEPVFKPINWKQEAQKDKLVGEHTPYFEIQGFKQKIQYFLYRYIIK